MTLSTSELLERVADRLETLGWQQGSAGGVSGPNCMMGAISQVLHQERGTHIPGSYRRDQETWGLRNKALRALRDAAGAPGIAAWNDTPGRTRQEVLDATRKAAKLARLSEEGIS